MVMKVLKPVSSVSGIISNCDVMLAQLPQKEWIGRVVRPMHLNFTRDRGSYVITGICGITATSQVNKEMANGDQKMSYHEFFSTKYPMYEKCLLENDQVWLNYATLPLGQVTRLTSGRDSCANCSKGAQACKPICFEEHLSYSLVVHPLPAWLWILVSITPYVLHQMQRCILNLELSEALTSMLYDATPQEEFPPALPSKCVIMPDRLNSDSVLETDRQVYDEYVILDPNYGDWDQSEEFLLAGFNDKQLVPTATQLFCPMTTDSARDFSNLERMEWLGDSFLKFIATVVTFAECSPNSDEGCLTTRRMGYISNAYLHKKAQDLKLPHFFTGYEFKPSINYLPPGYTSINLDEDLNRGDPRFAQALKLKTVADSVESLIGTILCAVGASAALRFMNILEIVPWNQEQVSGQGTYETRMLVARNSSKFCNPIMWRQLIFDEKRIKNVDPDDNNLSICVRMMQNLEIQEAQKKKGKLQTDQIINPREAQNRVMTRKSQLSAEYRPLMELIGYNFKKIEYLHQAFTHATAADSGTFGNYQRFEFLGDGVLDRVIASRIFAENPRSNPGNLTDLKIALVENIHLSCLMCKFKLHTWINHNIEGLNEKINVFANHRQSVQHSSIPDPKTKELNVKILADVFEALIGAVFLDSDCNEDTISCFVNRFFDDSIKALQDNTPMNNRRLLFETMPTLKVTPLHYNEDGSTSFKVNTPRGQFITAGKDLQAVLDKLANELLKNKK
ncbi:hypothetical protein Ciccas_002452 [Cichlidogyrus casuarinus]|uniref:RNase III domain-containing protein n=1 Tax=Cichlidogyrus casuarinus TaxID=1844966 RepID=A0ABD2QHF9_9PLAT